MIAADWPTVRSSIAGVRPAAGRPSPPWPRAVRRHRAGSHAGDATVKELARPFGMSLQGVSRHIGVLRRCGLIDQRVDGQRRPCRLNRSTMTELADWISVQRQQWDDRFDALEDHLA